MSIKTKSGILLLILLAGWIGLIMAGFNHSFPVGIGSIVIPLLITLLINK